MLNHPDDLHVLIEARTAERQFVLISRHETIGKAQHDMLARQITHIASRKKVQ